MAFDRTDPADLAALKTEVTTDPIGMGYNLNGSATRVVFLLNDSASNKSPSPVERPFDKTAMLDALDPTELDAQQTEAGAGDYINALMAYDGDIGPYKDKFGSMFADNSATFVALDSQTILLSRAEVLFGQGTNISENDLATALSI